MRTILSLIAILVFSFGATAQIKDPVIWSTSSKKKGDAFEVTITATLPKPWHIYSQHTGEGGPLPTKFKFTPSPLLTFQGGVKEDGKLKEEHDPNFDTKVKYFGDKVSFVQLVKVRGNVKTNVNVTVEYMTCDDSQCLPPTKKSFSVSL